MDQRARPSRDRHDTNLSVTRAHPNRAKSPEKARHVRTTGDLVELFCTIGEDVLTGRMDHAQAGVAIQAYSNAIRTLDLQDRWARRKSGTTSKTGTKLIG